ncbi:MAG: hypothetical protein ACKO34_01535 [Vampirovibrionales bacterium]
MEQGRKKAVLKEAIQIVSEAVFQGVTDGSLDSSIDSEDYLVSKINHVQSFPNNGSTHCSPPASSSLANYPTKGVLLPSGACIDFYHVASNYQLAYINYDGKKTAIWGQTALYLCYNSTQTTQVNTCGTLKPGESKAHGYYPSVVTLYNSLYN